MPKTTIFHKFPVGDSTEHFTAIKMAAPCPEVFTTAPPQPKEKKPGQLTEAMVKQFFEDGYVMVEDFFNIEELEPCRRSIEKLVDDLAQKLKKAGKISNTYEEYGLFERLAWLEKEFPGTSIILHTNGTLTKAFQDVWTNERVLNVMEQLVGPEVMGNPVWNLRVKAPNTEAGVVPWHQDAAYFDDEGERVLQVTGWIPLLDANAENGCLQMARGGHRKGRVAKHENCYGNTWHVMLSEEEMAKSLGVDVEKDIITVPVKYGGILLFNNLTPHRSLSNVSKVMRWSLDLRWQSANDPVGFYGLKEGLVFRSTKQSEVKIDWEDYLKERHTEAGIKDSSDKKKDEFDTIITGPWMYKWEITHPNRHTAALQRDKTTWQKA